MGKEVYQEEVKAATQKKDRQESFGWDDVLLLLLGSFRLFFFAADSRVKKVVAS